MATYTVRSRDTLHTIAVAHGTTWETLYALNRAVVGSNPDVIEVGMVLQLPGASQTSYTVKSGDTLSAIAAAHGTTTTNLYNLNKAVIGSDPNKIQPGMVLTLSASAPAPAPAPTPVPSSSAALDPHSVTFTRYTLGGTVNEWIDAACVAAGVPANSYWRSGFQTLIDRESGGNPNACNTYDMNSFNPSGYSSVADYGDGYSSGGSVRQLNGAATPFQCSRGVAQCIPQTFAAYHRSGTSTSIYNPVANIASSIGYVRHDYGVASDGSNFASRVPQANPNANPQVY